MKDDSDDSPFVHLLLSPGQSFHSCVLQDCVHPFVNAHLGDTCSHQTCSQNGKSPVYGQRKQRTVVSLQTQLFLFKPQQRLLQTSCLPSVFTSPQEHQTFLHDGDNNINSLHFSFRSSKVVLLARNLTMIKTNQGSRLFACPQITKILGHTLKWRGFLTPL